MHNTRTHKQTQQSVTTNPVSVIRFGIIMFLFLTAFSNSRAQDFAQALREMQMTLKDASQMQIVMNISVYQSADKKNLIYHDNAEVNRKEENYLYRYSASDFLLNERYLVLVDKNEKEISWTPRGEVPAQALNQQNLFNIDSILSLYDQVQHVAREKDTDHFRITQNEGSVRQIDLWVNISTHLLKDMQYQYDGGQLVVITFKQFDLHPVFDKDFFNETKYVSLKGREARLQPAYKNYRISQSGSTWN